MGATYPCHVRRLLKTLAIDGRNVVTVGDRVWFRPGGAAGDEGLIEKVEARQRRDHPRLSPPPARPRRQRRPGADRLGAGRAGPEARPDRPLPGLGRDRRRPARRSSSTRPTWSTWPRTSGSSACTPSSATRRWSPRPPTAGGSIDSASWSPAASRPSRARAASARARS